MNKIYFLILLLIFLSCEEKKVSNKEKPVESSYEVNFDTKLNVKNKIYSLNGKEYISFYDFKTRKRIEVFTLDGKKIKSIDLTPLIDKSRIISYDIISLDSIVLLSKYSNRVFFINDKCDILYEKDYSNLLLQSIELSHPINFDNKVLKCGINFYDINFPENPTLEDYITSNEIGIEFPVIFIDSHLFNQNNYKYSYFLDSIYSRFISKDELGKGGKIIVFSDDKIYFANNYTDSVYIFDNQNKLKQILSLKSDNFTLKPTKYKDFIRNMNRHNEEFQKNGFLWSFGASNSGTKFYSLFCKKSTQRPKPFTILLYDKNFSVIKEINPDPKRFYPIVLLSEEGYYIMQNNEGKKNVIFNYFVYE